MTEELILLKELASGPAKTTPLIVGLMNKGIPIGVSATNKLRLLRKKDYVECYKREDSAEKEWCISREGRIFLDSQLNPKLF